MKKLTIYLSGRVDGLNRDEAMGWRNKLKPFLEPEFNITMPDYQFDTNNINEIWMRNYFLIDNADILIVNMDYEKDSPFLGTSMEIERAHFQRKPVIIYSKKDWVKENKTLQYHAIKIIGNQVELIDFVKSFL